MVMAPEKPQTEVGFQKDPDEEERQGVMFESVQAAADFLRDKARQEGVDEAVIADIEYIGDCDQQSRTRIERYCAELDLESRLFHYPGR